MRPRAGGWPARRAAPLSAVLALLLLWPAAPRADELKVDVPVTAAVAGGTLLTYGVLDFFTTDLTPSRCRWCEPPGIDRNARLHLRWGDTKLASNLSDVGLAAVPIALLAGDYLASGRDFGRWGEDTLVAFEAIGVTLIAVEATKYGFGRRRPEAWAYGVRTSAGDDNAFISGHAAATFAFAGAMGSIAKLRGYRGWPIVYAAGFTGAAAVSYLRVAADRHWLTDVLAGAAVGTAIGVGMPLLFHRGTRLGDPNSVAFVVTPMPLGVAGTF